MVSREYKITHIVINLLAIGPHLTSSIMSFHGATALVFSSDRIKMPTNIKEMSRLFPRVLRLCYNTGMTMKKTVQKPDEVCESEESAADVEDHFIKLSTTYHGNNLSKTDIYTYKLGIFLLFCSCFYFLKWRTTITVSWKKWLEY